MIPCQQTTRLAESFGNDAKGGSSQPAGDFLFETGDRESGLSHDLTAVGRERAVEQFEECALAGTIASKESDPLGALDGEARAIEHGRPAERDADVLEFQQCHEQSYPARTMSIPC